MIAVPEWSTPEEIERDIPAIGDLHRYWVALNGGRPPTRASVDPEAIKSLLPHILLVDFETEPFRVRYRLTGTAIDSETGYNFTGLYLDELLMDRLIDGVQLLDAYERAAISGAPQVGTYRWLKPWPAEYRVPFGIFPLSVNGNIMQALGIEQVRHLPPFQEGKTWRDWQVIHEAGGPSGLELMRYR